MTWRNKGIVANQVFQILKTRLVLTPNLHPGRLDECLCPPFPFVVSGFSSSLSAASPVNPKMDSLCQPVWNCGTSCIPNDPRAIGLRSIPVLRRNEHRMPRLWNKALVVRSSVALSRNWRSNALNKCDLHKSSDVTKKH